METGIRCLRILRPQIFCRSQHPMRQSLFAQSTGAVKQPFLFDSWLLPRRFPRHNTTKTSTATTNSTDSPTVRKHMPPFSGQKGSQSLEQCASKPSKGRAKAKDSKSLPLPQVEKAYLLSFQCKPCKARSIHRITHHGYHKGTVLVSCPTCKQKHLISDHLKIFSDTSVTIETILQKNGGFMMKGNVDLGGDFEYWSKESVAEREKEMEERLGTQKSESMSKNDSLAGNEDYDGKQGQIFQIAAAPERCEEAPGK